MFGRPHGPNSHLEARALNVTSESLSKLLTGRYTVERELGRGGMATVYLGRDLKHEREVAIKVLHFGLASTVGAERFLQEIRTTASLQHPNILPVFDSGEVDGGLFYVMPHIEGESLRAQLDREPFLPVEEVARLTEGIAAALDFAHARGIVHRDIKPENILLHHGQPMVADFGIALAVSGATDRLTATGVSIGTPEYMSPEQASGERQLDARTDVYALGAMAYEMLAGEPPFTGPTAQAVVARVLVDSPRPITTVRAAVPVAMEAVVLKALAKQPVDRYPSAGALAAALSGAATSPRPRITSRRATIAAAAFMLCVVAALGIWKAGALRSSVSDEPRYVAVLPFENRGPQADAYLVDGLTDQVRGKFAAVRGLAVIASASSDRFRSRDVPIERIAEELGAEYVLTGRYRASGGGRDTSRFVHLELVRAIPRAPARVVWQDSLRIDPRDAGAAPRDIASAVVTHIGVVVDESARRAIGRLPTRDSLAWDEFLQGSEGNRYFNASVREMEGARSHFLAAVRRDSAFVEAWARLARTQASLNDTLAAVSIARALELNAKHPETAIALASYEQARGGDFARVQVVASDALTASPNDPRVLQALGVAEEGLGRFEEAIRYFHRAERLDPKSAETQGMLSVAYTLLRRYDDAMRHARRAIAIDSLRLAFHANAMNACVGAGDLVCARRVIHAVPAQIGTATTLARIPWMTIIGPRVLDDADLRLLVKLGQAPWGGDRAGRLMLQAQAHLMLGDPVRARAYAESTLRDLRDSVRTDEGDATYVAILSMLSAYAGRPDSARAQAARAVALMPIEKNAANGPIVQYNAACAYARIGDVDSAVAAIGRVLSVPSPTSVAAVRLDADLSLLRGDPRFEAMLSRVSAER